MNEDNYLIVAVLSLVISGIFFYTVIKAAVKSALTDKENKEKSNLDYEIKIFKMLTAIAKNNGVAEDRIKEIEEAENFLNERKILSKKASKKSWF